MKTFGLSFILSALVWSLSSAQQKKHQTTYEVQYEANYSMDSTHLSDKTKETLFLYTSADFGVFTNYDVIEFENWMTELRKKQGSASVSATYSHGSSQNPSLNKEFYKNLQTGTVKTVVKIADNRYIYEEPKTDFDWQIMDSTQTLNGYVVQKASLHFAGRDYVAWFTLQIPIPNGPYLFSGLPGLIVKMYDLPKEYIFTLKSIKKLEPPKTWTLPDEVTHITKDKYKKMRTKWLEKLLYSSDLGYMMSNTPGVSGSTSSHNGKIIEAHFELYGQEISKQELKRRFKESIKRKNNFIELQ